MSNQPPTDDELTAIRARAEAATPEPMERNLYEHGGGRMFVDGEAGKRQLVLDAYKQNDRDFYFNARRDVLTLLAEVERLRKMVADLQDEKQDLEDEAISGVIERMSRNY